MKPTVSKLAKVAGVSTATVDRVLNNRPGVSARTRQIVEAAARQIGYVAVPEDAPTPKHFVALLPTGSNAFMDELRAHLQAEAALFPEVTLSMPKVSAVDPRPMAKALTEIEDADGVAVVALSHPRVHDALQQLIARKIPVVTLLSDLPDTLRQAYIGVDNLRAGRLAAEVITRFLGPKPAGQVALFAGSMTYRGHHERDLGLRQYLSEEAPQLDLLDLRESGDDRSRAYALAREKIQQFPGISAIYNAGGGTTGIAQALQDEGRASDVIFVAHEATAENRALLLDGTLDAIIDQNAKREAQETLATLMATARGQRHSPTQPRLHLILKENIPSDSAPIPAGS